MEHQTSSRFNCTERMGQPLLGLLYRKRNLGSFYSGCKVTCLRPMTTGLATGVDAPCTHQRDPTSPFLDRERVYGELVNQTKNITELAPYSLDSDSLCINGSAVTTLIPATSLSPSPFASTTAHGHSLEAFTSNFTINNLIYTAEMEHPDSSAFTTTDRILRHLLGHLFQNSSIGPSYSGCKLTFPRPMKDGLATRVGALCTYQKDPNRPVLDRERLYGDLRNQTYGISMLGPYCLAKDSLYLNAPGLTTIAPPAIPLGPTGPGYWTASDPRLQHFTLKFTITNLRYTADMGHPGSTTFNDAGGALQRLLGPLFRNSSIGLYYTGCGLISLRPEKDGLASRVDALCVRQKGPTSPVFDRGRIYMELSSQTHGLTKLGPYTLEKASLCLKGYSSQSTPGEGEYQVDFRIINHNLSNPEPTSPEYQALQRDIQDKMTQLYAGSQLQDRFPYCLITGLRLGSVYVTCNCSFSSNLDPDTIGQVFLDRTQDATAHWLRDSYKLDNLQVTKLEPAAPLSTAKPLIDPRPRHFQLNFTITSVLYSLDLSRPDSAKYQGNQNGIEDALTQLFRNSSIKSYFSDCHVQTFRLVSPFFRLASPRHLTGVDCLCDFTSAAQARNFDRAAMYEEFLRLTHNGTRLQNFTLDQNNILVDGYSTKKIDGNTKKIG
uniref:Mucin-16-like isoform X2 n=1 Tax=Phascolarctos cinereus TaxID=38626 RepID=A0A6P5JWL9_PHACI|nr:mucin-16-like isoform X2 [Phascolarctos cinereus]